VSDILISHISLKGSRNYIHGTDIYQWCAELLPILAPSQQIASLSLEFHRLALSQLALPLSDNQASRFSHQKPCTTLRIKIANERKDYHFFESGLPPAGSRPYDESLIAKECQLDGQSVTRPGPPSLKPIESLVSMTKALHQLLFGANTQWLWAKIEAPKPLPPQGWEHTATIRMKQNLAGRFTVSEAFVDDTFVGLIYFSKR